ncbi:MAG: hypothetical protein P1V20_13840 [Verrucomicrobiales bacterium]|nr:hypothetical protein [Verrucomicrobiales bacterium]
MKNLIFATFVALFVSFSGTQSVEAFGSCIKKKVCTEEVCRRTFCKTKMVCGCAKQIQFVEVTYRSTYRDCCGNCSYRTFTKTYRY